MPSGHGSDIAVVDRASLRELGLRGRTSISVERVGYVNKWKRSSRVRHFEIDAKAGNRTDLTL
jgi:hypothetical protein